jgi:hypothetical protein
MSARLAGIDCAACPHVRQALSGALEICAHALGTCVPICTGRTARFFFMLEAHLSWKARFGAIGYVVALEPNSVGRRDPEPYDTWQCRRPAQPGGEVRSHRTRGSTIAYLSR